MVQRGGDVPPGQGSTSRKQSDARLSQSAKKEGRTHTQEQKRAVSARPITGVSVECPDRNRKMDKSMREIHLGLEMAE